MNAHANLPTSAAAVVAVQLSDEIEAVGPSLHAIAGSLGRHYETVRRYARLERALIDYEGPPGLAVPCALTFGRFEGQMVNYPGLGGERLRTNRSA